jgi:subtilisin family serine protease
VSNLTIRTRWGLGPGIDPHFDARVGRIAAGGAAQKGGPPASSSGYLEFTGPRACEHLEALMEVLYEQAPRQSGRIYRMSRALGLHDRPFVWTQVSALRYLTSGPNTGVALPLHDFNPVKTAPGWPAQAPVRLREAIDRLHVLTRDRLKSATLIGLTVSFQFEVGAGALAQELRPSGRRWFGAGDAWPGSRVQTALFGGAAPSLGPAAGLWGRVVGAPRFDGQRVGIAGGCSAQLQRAMRDLAFDDLNPTPANELDYGMPERGKGTIVGIVDFGCDFAHPSFHVPDGVPARSRLLALWDQNDAPEAPLTPPPIVLPAAPVGSVAGQDCRFGYGRMFTREQIDQVLRTWLAQQPQDPELPYALLGYDPHHHHYTQQPPGTAGGPAGAHGTMVMDIAAGGPRGAEGSGSATDLPIVRGVASEADIVFVQVRLHHSHQTRDARDPRGPRRVLNLNDVVDAVAFVFHVAEREGRPCVVNLSLNTMSGPHDGDGYFERRIASLLRSGPAGPEGIGRAVVIAAGNLPYMAFERQRWQHLADEVRPGSRFEFFWRIDAADPTRNTIEIWYDAQQAWLQVSLVSAEGDVIGPVLPGQAGEIYIDDAPRGSVVGSRLMPAVGDGAQGQALPADDTAPGRHAILIEIEPDFPHQTFWTVVLECVDRQHAALTSGAAVPFHAWLERDDDGQSGLCRSARLPAITDDDRRTTIGTLSCGEDTIVVGAYSTSASSVDRLNRSARGPSRKQDIRKPDLAAPGHLVRVIRSKPAVGSAPACVGESGTSLAAPFVAGTIACVYEAAPQATLAQVRDALTATTRPPLDDPQAPWTSMFGHGRLNPAAAVAKVKAGFISAASPLPRPRRRCDRSIPTPARSSGR